MCTDKTTTHVRARSTHISLYISLYTHAIHTRIVLSLSFFQSLYVQLLRRFNTTTNTTTTTTFATLLVLVGKVDSNQERDDCGGISRCCDVYQNVRFENNNNEHIVIIDGAVVEIDENSIRAVSVGRFSGWGIRHHSSVESNEKRRRKRRENHDDEKDDDENEE